MVVRNMQAPNQNRNPRYRTFGRQTVHCHFRPQDEHQDTFWNALKEIADRRNLTLSELIGAIPSERQRGKLSSAIRLFVFEFYRDRIREYENRETMRQILGNATVAIATESDH